MWCKGKVQGNVVILEEGIQLPDGMDVIVMTEYTEEMADGAVGPTALVQRHALVAQRQAFGQRLAGQSVHLSDALLESQEEIEASA